MNAIHTNHAPNISNQVFSINDGSANNTEVGKVVAGDVDGDTLTYSITASTPSSAFSINPTSGEISVSNSAELVYTTHPSFSLTVQVQDSAGLTASAAVTVNVNAASAPPPANPPAASGGGGGCSVMPVGANPDSSLALAVLVLLGYGLRRRKFGSLKTPYR